MSSNIFRNLANLPWFVQWNIWRWPVRCFLVSPSETERPGICFLDLTVSLIFLFPFSLHADVSLIVSTVSFFFFKLVNLFVVICDWLLICCLFCFLTKWSLVLGFWFVRLCNLNLPFMFPLSFLSVWLAIFFLSDVLVIIFHACALPSFLGLGLLFWTQVLAYTSTW